MPKYSTKSPFPQSQIIRHNPLHENPIPSSIVPSRKLDRRTREENRNPGFSDTYINGSLSRKILHIAREQQNELGTGSGSNGYADSGGLLLDRGKHCRKLCEGDLGDSQDDDNNYDSHDYRDNHFEKSVSGEDPPEQPVVINEADDEVFGRFVTEVKHQQIRSLTDRILEKIAEHETTHVERHSAAVYEPKSKPREMLPPKVVEAYGKIGILLSRYKSGKLPKAFKIIPTLGNWEDILLLTQPETWSPYACYEATKMFASNLNAVQTQRFLNFILLDRIRQDIQENKKLHVHLYKALKKALYKPSAFNKGFLFPLCNSGTCTLREAQIVGSVLSRVSIPVLHSAAALQRLCDMDYTSPVSLLIRVLLEKKYALPYKAIDSVVFHFLRFANTEDCMPLIWHQSLLSFATRYKNDITEDQRQALFELIRKKGHPANFSQIILELEAGKQDLRGEYRNHSYRPEKDDDEVMQNN